MGRTSIESSLTTGNTVEYLKRILHYVILFGGVQLFIICCNSIMGNMLRSVGANHIAVWESAGSIAKRQRG